MNSIRHALLRYLMLALIIISLITGVITYLTTAHETEELLTHNLKQIALAVAQQPRGLGDSSHSRSTKNAREMMLPAPMAEEDFLIQIWHRTTLVYSSHSPTHFPLSEREGLSRITYGNASWCTYTMRTPNAVVQVAQPPAMQKEMLREVVQSVLIPLAVQIPLIALFVWLIVGRSLRPLKGISAAISARHGRLLTPLPLIETPLEVKPLVAELNALLKRLGNSLEIQRQFTANAAHELRTPLTAIQLQLNILQRAQTDEEKARAMQKLAAGIQRGVRLVHQLLSLARQEHEAVTRPLQTFDMGALVRSVIEQAEAAIAEKNMHLTLAATQPVQAAADAEGVRILLTNLIDNAIRYTPAGGHIRVALDAVFQGVQLTVADNGGGIDAAEHGKVFDRFYRVPGSATFGTGLGLAIVKTIADRHAAQLVIGQGLEGKGVSFTVIFPFATKD